MCDPLYKELLALRNNFRATKKILTAKLVMAFLNTRLFLSSCSLSTISTVTTIIGGKTTIDSDDKTEFALRYTTRLSKHSH